MAGMTEQSRDSFFSFRDRALKELGTAEAILAAFAAGPDDLTHALAGLSEPDLDLARGPGKWTIRQTVHHVVDGDSMWGMCARVAMATRGLCSGWIGTTRKRGALRWIMRAVRLRQRLHSYVPTATT
jgi:hypothetical protein